MWTTTVNRLNQVTLESLAGLKIIRLFTAEARMRQNFITALWEANDSRRRAAYITAFSAPMLTCFVGLFICVLLFVMAGLNNADPSVWVPSVLLFLFLLFRLLGPVSAMAAARNRVVTQMHAFEMLTGFYEETAARRQSNGSLPAPRLQDRIVFDNVTFAYPNAPDRPAVEALNLTIRRGTMCAIVGASGSGKSTMIGLLTRLFDPQKGRILVDGVDLRELEIVSWRGQLAVVTQDVFIFNETVGCHIALGRPHASAHEIEKAAQVATADSFIGQLSQRYETVLGDLATHHYFRSFFA